MELARVKKLREYSVEGNNILLLTLTEWCTILSIEDNKTYTCSTKALGTDTCNFVTETDLIKGRELIWTYKGVPYTVELMDVHGRCNICLFYSRCDQWIMISGLESTHNGISIISLFIVPVTIVLDT